METANFAKKGGVRSFRCLGEKKRLLVFKGFRRGKAENVSLVDGERGENAGEGASMPDFITQKTKPGLCSARKEKGGGKCTGHNQRGENAHRLVSPQRERKRELAVRELLTKRGKDLGERPFLIADR